MDGGDIPNWGAAIIAAISLIVSLWNTREAQRHQTEITALSRKQHELGLRAWAEQYFTDVRTWADRVCCTISEAIHMHRLDQDDPRLRMELLSRLSALLDSGRWYFPNRFSDEIGLHKPAAYRGLRQPVLDTICAAYDCMRAGEVDCSEQLVAVQRSFVSHIQAVLDPGVREQEISRVLAEFRTAARMRTAAPAQ